MKDKVIVLFIKYGQKHHLDALLQSVDPTTRTLAVYHERGNIPRDKLSQLAKDRNVHVRREVSKIYRTPPEALDMLAHSHDAEGHTQFYVAGHPNTSPETLTYLAKHNWCRVRECVAQHQNTPFEVLNQLMYDRDGGVRQSAGKTLRWRLQSRWP